MDRKLSEVLNISRDEAPKPRSRILESVGLSGMVRQPEEISSCQTDVWEELDSPRRLRRRFTFDNQPQVSSFIQELLEHQAESQHHGRITINENQTVDVEVYTHDLNDITEMDREYASTADLIYRDVSAIKRKIHNDFGW